MSRRPVRRRRSTRWIWRLGFALFLLVALVAGTGVGYIYFGSKTLRQMVRIVRQGDLRPAKAFPGQDELTVLFLGRDVDLDNHARVVHTRGRTDTIMLVHLDFANKTANMLSIPRDTKVRIPGYRGIRKINAAHALGGPELTIETVSNLLNGLGIEHSDNVQPEQYIVVDYTSFAKAIDLIGGLKVDVAKEMDYDDNWGNLHIHLKPGTQILEGKDALGYVRFRKSNDGRSVTDQDRIARQQQFLMAMKSKMVSPTAFVRMPSIIETIRSGVKSSMSDSQMMSIAQFVRSLPPGSIHTAILPSTNSRVYVTADRDAARKLVDSMF